MATLNLFLYRGVASSQYAAPTTRRDIACLGLWLRGERTGVPENQALRTAVSVVGSGSFAPPWTLDWRMLIMQSRSDWGPSLLYRQATGWTVSLMRALFSADVSKQGIFTDCYQGAATIRFKTERKSISLWWPVTSRRNFVAWEPPPFPNL